MVLQISCEISNAMLNSQLEILERRPFLISSNFETQSCQCYGVKRIKSIFVDMVNSRTRFAAPFYSLKVVFIFSIKPFSSNIGISLIFLICVLPQANLMYYL